MEILLMYPHDRKALPQRQLWSVSRGSGGNSGRHCLHHLHNLLLYQQIQQEEGDRGGLLLPTGSPSSPHPYGSEHGGERYLPSPRLRADPGTLGTTGVRGAVHQEQRQTPHGVSSVAADPPQRLNSSHQSEIFTGCPQPQ
ncbi:uncharacterized protein LOC111100541 isoform X3 [Crassostrea virginica]